jgi:hypothetical protein
MSRSSGKWNGGLVESVPFLIIPLHVIPLAVLALPAVVLAWLAPYVASKVSGANNNPQLIAVAGKVVVEEGKYESNLRLEFSSSTRVSQTMNVSAWLQPDTSAPPTAYLAKLESGDLKIVSTNASDSASREYKYQWDWLISADKTGDRALYFWVEPSSELVVRSSTADVRLGAAKNKVLLPISVLTELGLTTTQDAWAKTIGAIIGVVGTVVGFAFWKWNRKEKDKEDSDAIGQSAIGSDKTHDSKHEKKPKTSENNNKHEQQPRVVKDKNKYKAPKT